MPNSHKNKTDRANEKTANVRRENQEKDNLRRANTHSAHAASNKQTQDDSFLSSILNLAQKAGVNSKEEEKSTRSVVNSYDADEKSHLLATMAMFVKKHVLTPESFSWLKSSMSVIGKVFDVVTALFSKGLLKAFNLDRIMGLPIIKGINTLFQLVDSKDESLNQKKFDETLNSVSDEFVNGINADTASTSAGEALVRAVTGNFKTDEFIDAVSDSPLAANLMAGAEQLKEVVIDSAQEYLADEDNKEEMKTFLTERVLTPEVQAQLIAVGTDIVKEKCSQVYESSAKAVASNVDLAASYVSQAATSAGNSLYSFFCTKAQQSPAPTEAAANTANTSLQAGN